MAALQHHANFLSLQTRIALFFFVCSMVVLFFSSHATTFFFSELKQLNFLFRCWTPPCAQNYALIIANRISAQKVVFADEPGANLSPEITFFFYFISFIVKTKNIGASPFVDGVFVFSYSFQWCSFTVSFFFSLFHVTKEGKKKTHIFFFWWVYNFCLKKKNDSWFVARFFLFLYFQ